jgi:Ca2+-binding RTX toxin-like protein
VGGAGNDTIKGNDGNDILIGGEGADLLEGGNGVDTYVWNLGDGSDTINDYAYRGDAYGLGGILKLGGISREDIELTRLNNDAVFIMGGSCERITVQGWYASADNQLKQIEFEDGTVWSRAEINALSPTLRGTGEDDTITGFATNDILVGNEGNDTLKGNDGNDILIGGEGADFLEGGNGVDTYVWNLGDGSDTINDYAYRGDAYGLGGTLKLGGVSREDIELTRLNNDAVFVMGGSGEKITVQGWYASADYQLKQIEFADGTVWSRAEINALSPTLRGTDADDTINGYATNDTLVGGGGNDTIKGNDGNDILIGGEGADLLEGGNGVDTYLWNLGDGSDTINDYAYRGDAYGFGGTLKLGEGISLGNMELTRVNNDAVFIIGESGERITVQGWYASADNQLKQIEFEDGTVWSRAEINALSPTLRGTDGDDTINGYATNDTLVGGGGNDTLKGSDGNDILIGGEGADLLEGGNGVDTYVWNLGDGLDTIYDYAYRGDAYGLGGILKFGEGVSLDNMELTRSNNDAVFVVGESGERVSVKDWYASGDYQLKQIEFADGTTWTRAQINATSPVLRGTDGDDAINGYATNDTLVGGAGNDTIKGGDGNDILVGGGGADSLEGGNGVDSYIWNLGDGDDKINDYVYRADAYGLGGVLKLGEGVSLGNMELTRVNNDAVFIIGESGERITVQGWYTSGDYQLKQIEFADGTTWARAQINATSPVIRGTDGNETVTGTASNDILIGGAGSDRLEGGAGNDIYKWNLGDGNDLIVDNSGTNLLELGEGINPMDIALARLGNDAVFTVGGTGEQISVYNWYANANYQLSSVQFKDGTVWNRTDINNSAV